MGGGLSKFCRWCLGRELQLAGVIEPSLAEGQRLSSEDRRAHRVHLCLCLLLSVPTVVRGYTACCVPPDSQGALGRAICRYGKVCGLPTEGPKGWTVMTSFCARLWGDGLSSLRLSNCFWQGKCDLMVFAELNRVPSGVLGGRVGAIASCVKLRVDGLGSLRLSSCKRPMEKVACYQGKAGRVLLPVGNWLRCVGSAFQLCDCCVAFSLLKSARQ